MFYRIRQQGSNWIISVSFKVNGKGKSLKLASTTDEKVANRVRADLNWQLKNAGHQINTTGCTLLVDDIDKATDWVASKQDAHSFH